MGCGASTPEAPAPEPEPSPEEIAKQKKAEEAAAINAQIAAKMAAKPVQKKEEFKRKFDGFKRAENRDRHNVHRTGAGEVRASEVERIQSRLEAVKQKAKLVKQKTTNFIVHFGDSNPDHAHETLGERMKRNLTRRSRHSTDEEDSEPQHGHGLTWAAKSMPAGGLRRALTRKLPSFVTKRGSRASASMDPKSSTLFASSKPLEGGLEAYDNAEAAEGSSKKIKFADAPGTQKV